MHTETEVLMVYLFSIKLTPYLAYLDSLSWGPFLYYIGLPNEYNCLQSLIDLKKL